MAPHGDHPVNCPACGTANEPGRKFCGECGTRLSAACPACGTLNAPDTKFCGECGTGLTDAAAPAGGPTPVAATGAAERRLVSVLFADLVGSTTLAEDQDPEETRELLSRYFDAAREVIDRYGGTIEKFIGDAVMAVWGVPTAHEDDAERAVRAALDLVEAVAHLEGATLQARAGVLTGEAAATVGASGQGMVAGDLVNTASRLQSVAPAGAVLVGESTYHATREAIRYEEAGEQLLKGKTTPVPAWRAMAVTGLRGGAGRSTALEAPFVGRDDDLRLVKDLFEATVREGKPRLVTVIGQAGIGKSRLAWEFEKYIDGVVGGTFWHEGRSPAYGEGISFWALGEMVRFRAGIADGEDPEIAREQLRASVDEFVTDADERRWIEPRLAGLLGLEELPAGQREELFAAWRTFFERMAQQDPVCLVFTDLHWADTGLLDFIEHLLDWAKTSPIFVLALTRPELYERRPGWGSGVRSATSVTLEPLPDSVMRELLQGLAAGLPESLVTAVCERAGGIPLYAVETVRMLIDRGQLVASGHGFALAEGAERLDRLAVPETLHALIAARLDANSPEDRALISDAAVLGQSFTITALEGLTGEPAEALMPRLQRLVTRDLLVRQDDPRSPERGQYAFLQSVVKEVAYESLAKKDRRAKHLAAARYFEALGDDELAGVLASHYLEAYRSTPPGPEADALANQARIALRAAGDRAAALYSARAAVHYYEDALDVTTEPAEIALLHDAAARSAGLVDAALARQHGQKAVETYRALGNAAGELRALGELARIFNHEGKLSDAITLLEPLTADSSRDGPETAFALAELARAYMLSDQGPAAIATADRALAALGNTHNPRVVVEALTSKASAIWTRADESEALLRGAIAIADAEGLTEPGLRARNNLVSGIMYNVTATATLRILDDAADTSRRLGIDGWLLQLLTVSGIVRFHTGDWAACEDDLAELESLKPDASQAAGLHGMRAVMLAYRGDAAAAASEIAEANRWGETYESAGQLAVLDELNAEVSIAFQRYPEALQSARAGATRAGDEPDAVKMALLAIAAAGNQAALGSMDGFLLDSGFRQSTALVDLSAALRAAFDGRWDEARVRFRDAVDLINAVEWRLDAANMALLFDAYLGARFPDARAAGVEAEAFFAGLGAGDYPRRFRAAFAGTPAPPTGVQDRSSSSSRTAVAVDAEQPA